MLQRAVRRHSKMVRAQTAAVLVLVLTLEPSRPEVGHMRKVVLAPGTAEREIAGWYGENGARNTASGEMVARRNAVTRR